MEITTSIIPTKPTFVNVHGPSELDKEAICVFAAIGFFLDTDTYFKNIKVLKPASKNTIDPNAYLVESVPWFKWYHEPRAISFDEALEEFTDIFENIISDQTNGKKVILPLSGGIDSRTQAVALKKINADVFSYSYQFEGGYEEISIAEKIADVCEFPFKGFKISKGYLWDVIDDLAALNKGYSDFTSPRQMYLYDKFENMGDVFSLGHWGDVLFDSMNLEQLDKSEEQNILIKKLLKRGGLELANSLWESWNLEGDFMTYFKKRIANLLGQIEIKNTNAKLRAFKSMYWAPRWTSVNLSIFNAKKTISLPYYDQRMCEFICTLPEDYLNDRKLQIAYIKKKVPQLAKITWQDHRPFNLNNFHLNKTPFNLPYKILNKLKRETNAILGRPYIERNWELQFVGKDNESRLKERLMNPTLNSIIPRELREKYFNAFITGDKLNNAHAINILLVMSTLDQFQKNE